jgi:hypothetical protein
MYTTRFASALLLLYLAKLQCANAQINNEPQTLFGNSQLFKKESMGFVIAPSLTAGKMDGGNAAVFNLRSGVNWQDRFSLGGYVQASINEIMPRSEVLPGLYMDYRSAGAYVEYTVSPKRLVHLSFPLYAGYGEVEMDNQSGAAGLGESNFLLLEPNALLEINLLSRLRLNLGAGYRMVSAMNYRGLNEQDLSGWTLNAGLKLSFTTQKQQP